MDMSLWEIFCDTAFAEQEIDVIGRSKVRPYEMLAKSFIRDGVVIQKKNSAIELADGRQMSEKLFALTLYNEEELTRELTAQWEKKLASADEEAKEFGKFADLPLNFNFSKI